MHYLITGGAGFVGSHLAEYLLKLGHKVSVIDNLSTGCIENIEHLKNDTRFSYKIDCVTNESLVANMIDKCDIIIHLAAVVGVKLVVNNPIHTLNSNISGITTILKKAQKKGKKILIASSSEVYGKSDKIPFGEDYNLVIGAPVKTRWGYACSKALNEFLALAYWKEKKLPVIICRFFNIVGPRQTGRYGMVMPNFITQALEQKPITVYGDGTQTRCFIYVKEVCKIVTDLSLNDKAVGEIYNVGSQEEITIRELANKIKNKINSTSILKYVPYKDAYGKNFEDMQRRVPDISKLTKLLGYAPKIKTDQIIEEMITWHHKNNQI